MPTRSAGDWDCPYCGDWQFARNTYCRNCGLDKLPEIAARIPHFQPMAFWLDRWPNPLADRVFTGRQERFDADLQLLFDQLGVPLNPAWLQRSNSSGPLQAASPDAGLSAAALEQLQVFYAEDFRRFGYSLEPADSER